MLKWTGALLLYDGQHSGFVKVFYVDFCNGINTQLFSQSSRNPFTLRPVTVGSEVSEVKGGKKIKN